MNIELIKKHYKTISNEKLISLATTEAHGLRKEVVPILMEEIRSRNLDKNIIEGFDRQMKKLTHEELINYCTIVQNCPCPYCGSTSDKLNGGVAKNTISVLLFTFQNTKTFIACRNCNNKFYNSANTKTALLGWWGLPWGPIKTIGTLIYNSKIRRESEVTAPSPLLQNFVKENIGKIEIEKNNPKGLQRIITITE
ncbi:hypothetical protein ACLI1A_17025 [Flavobacterium sp. RHBU_3]|uniref:hypothetical protein n=1 Tax=Flavobacterium sp. RHBU_3 TaxID=3391184 RepID=UPI0039851B7A